MHVKAKYKKIIEYKHTPQIFSLLIPESTEKLRIGLPVDQLEILSGLKAFFLLTKLYKL